MIFETKINNEEQGGEDKRKKEAEEKWNLVTKFIDTLNPEFEKIKREDKKVISINLHKKKKKRKGENRKYYKRDSMSFSLGKIAKHRSYVKSKNS
mmetsp:Transcript_19018/g.16852  ORF Transcript_19018/g.16852 Transcript_19018/m.16852 type:complete len:95 (-) Transcript_19018:638-922(-)